MGYGIKYCEMCGKKRYKRSADEADMYICLACRPKYYTGMSRVQLDGVMATIVDYKGRDNVIVRFEGGYEREVQLTHFLRGKLKVGKDNRIYRGLQKVQADGRMYEVVSDVYKRGNSSFINVREVCDNNVFSVSVKSFMQGTYRNRAFKRGKFFKFTDVDMYYEVVKSSYDLSIIKFKDYILYTKAAVYDRVSFPFTSQFIAELGGKLLYYVDKMPYYISSYGIVDYNTLYKLSARDGKCKIKKLEVVK